MRFRAVINLIFAVVAVIHLSGISMYVFKYLSNTAYYEAHCENISRPLMACHGKCQMAKEMQDEQKQLSRPYTSATFYFQSVYDYTQHITPAVFFADVLLHIVPRSMGYTQDFTSFIIQPPD